MILVIARMYSDFLFWCHSMEMSQHQPNVRYISRSDQLRGYDWPNVQLVLLSGWYLNKAIDSRDLRFPEAMGVEVLGLEF